MSLTTLVFNPVNVFFVTFCATPDLFEIYTSIPRSHSTSRSSMTERKRSEPSVKPVVGIVAIEVIFKGYNVLFSIFQCKTSTDSKLNKLITVVVFARIQRNGTNVSVLLMSNVMSRQFFCPLGFLYPQASWKMQIPCNRPIFEVAFQIVHVLRIFFWLHICIIRSVTLHAACVMGTLFFCVKPQHAEHIRNRVIIPAMYDVLDVY